LSTEKEHPLLFSIRQNKEGRRFAGEEWYIYTRLGNPTNMELEEKIAMLEGTEASTSTGSGMGAISAAFWTESVDDIIQDLDQALKVITNIN
jgi:O-acetylhomoserine/O-acetylserine sulfhydrylase-like pyridoxal-dependent enzyme